MQARSLLRPAISRTEALRGGLRNEHPYCRDPNERDAPGRGLRFAAKRTEPGRVETVYRHDEGAGPAGNAAGRRIANGARGNQRDRADLAADFFHRAANFLPREIEYDPEHGIYSAGDAGHGGSGGGAAEASQDQENGS